MTTWQSLLAFVVAAGVLTVTPGLDTAMVLRFATVGGPRRAALAGVGISLGCLVWGAGVALGLGALLAASELAFSVLKVAGAAYLLWLGVGLLWKPRRAFVAEADPSERRGDRVGLDALRRGFLTNMLNPKVGVFYVTFLPQFVPAGVNLAGYTFLLACIHVLLGGLWFTALITATLPLRRLLARPPVVQAMDRLTGCVFVAFGVKLALSRPP